MENNSRKPDPMLRSIVVALVFAAAAQATLALTGCGSKSETTTETSNPATTTTTTTTTEMPDTSAGATTATAGAGEGEKIFKQYCVLCHGAGGHGDGVGAKGLKPAPRNFHDKAYMSTRTDEQLMEVIRNGKGAMPAWGKLGTLKEDQIHAVLAYVRTFADQP